jgi:type IV pilus assembly protein PilV
MPVNGGRMTRSSRHRSDRRGAIGFTLVEVLVALLVLSIGLLGIGKMMMLSARANDSAYMRSQATALAYTMLDAMRANRVAAISQGYDTAQVVPAQQGCANAAPGCTSGQTAQNDTFMWNQALATALPSGAGTVVTATVPVGTGASNITATITVTWSDKVAEQSFGNPLAAGNMSVVLETVL